MLESNVKSRLKKVVCLSYKNVPTRLFFAGGWGHLHAFFRSHRMSAPPEPGRPERFHPHQTPAERSLPPLGGGIKLSRLDSRVHIFFLEFFLPQFDCDMTCLVFFFGTATDCFPSP